MSTALSIIKSSLRALNAYQSGDTIATPDANDCLEALNLLLESISTDHQMVFGANEWILAWTAGKRQYSIGNPTNAQLSGLNNTMGSAALTWPNMAGFLTANTPVITGVTTIPTNLVAGSAPAYQVGSGSILSDSQGLIPSGTSVLSFNASAQTIMMSANATANSISTDSIGYTVPGDFPIPRPLNITGGYTRFNQLDFTLDVRTTQDQYNGLLYKAQPGPWPTVAWYNEQFPYGLLNVYQQPGNGSELHLFTDTILGNLTLNQPIMMPQGYTRALKWLLAREIAAEFGFPLTEAIKTNCAEAWSFIKAMNARPAAVSRYDRILTQGNRGDAGFIFHGGYL